MAKRRTTFDARAMRAIKDMERAAATRAEIAAEVGSTPGSVSARLSQINGKRAERGFIVARLERVHVERFTAEASRRGMRRSRLIRVLLARIAADNLFQAVLDDDG